MTHDPNTPTPSPAPLDADEYSRWLRTARDQHLASAAVAAGAGQHATAVLLAEQAVQAVLKALLRGVGASDRAKGPRAPATGGRRPRGSRASWWLRPSKGDLRWLSASYQSSRYPDAIPSGTPSDHYGEAESRRALSLAQSLVAAVEARWRATVASADDGT